jgi:hypothetical protein
MPQYPSEDRTIKTRRSTFLSFSPPNLSEDEIGAVVDTLRSDWITTGPKTKQFETEFGAFIGAEASLALNSCTGGLHVALAALGIGPGDEVITTPMTFCSTANVIEHVGARPVLADVEPDTLTIDPARVAEAITPRTRAILPVHYAGHPAEMRPLLALAHQNKLQIIGMRIHARVLRRPEDHLKTWRLRLCHEEPLLPGGMLTGLPENTARPARSLHGRSCDA